MKKLYFFILICLTRTLNAQEPKFIGTYSDLLTEIELKADKTFTLTTIDEIYPQTAKKYTTEGIWENNKKTIILNPHLKKRKPIVNITEKTIGLKDSIQFKINHFNDIYTNETLTEKRKKNFDLLTIYFNKKRNYHHITREALKEGSCAFAPRIRHRINVDSTNTFTIAKEDINKIGIKTYGFQDFIEIPIQNKEADSFEIDVTVPIDTERTPRSKKIKAGKLFLFYYETKKGNVDLMANPLIRKKE